MRDENDRERVRRGGSGKQEEKIRKQRGIHVSHVSESKSAANLQSEGVFVDEGIRLIVFASVVEEQHEVRSKFLDVGVLQLTKKES